MYLFIYRVEFGGGCSFAERKKQLETQLILIQKIATINKDIINNALNMLNKIQKMINSLIKLKNTNYLKATNSKRPIANS